MEKILNTVNENNPETELYTYMCANMENVHRKGIRS